jgi:hypothetical protein
MCRARPGVPGCPVSVIELGAVGVNGLSGGRLLGTTLARIFASDDPHLRRLARAGTSVCFRVRGHADTLALTVLLDRDPPVVLAGEQPTEAVIELSDAQARALAEGRLSLPAAVYAGGIACAGSLRRYLVVDPVLRGLCAAFSAGGSRRFPPLQEAG